MTSLRVWYESGLEVEFGLTDDSWVSEPLDAGTRQVVSQGMQVVLDPQGRLSELEGAGSRDAPRSKRGSRRVKSRDSG